MPKQIRLLALTFIEFQQFRGEKDLGFGVAQCLL
jgi:hypothetical protein